MCTPSPPTLTDIYIQGLYAAATNTSVSEVSKRRATQAAPAGTACHLSLSLSFVLPLVCSPSRFSPLRITDCSLMLLAQACGDLPRTHIMPARAETSFSPSLLTSQSAGTPGACRAQSRG